ncbi:hypothetical protein [Acidocella aromatica]|uniref:Uncharacterized protein n=1 Tax=Acidocella aromatica TaxID=1303579 RepID=A0A840VFE5_9PROT|nr:hypothetical protein [Acidocella aromatica]MBB5374534.1 hypothetical protein [Acidocella aromatica]
MSVPNIWYLIKFFTEERYADQFMAGELYLNTLDYFRQVESADSDGRADLTEGIAMWWQPHDLVMKINFPGMGEVEITKNDLAGPVSMSFHHHNNLHLFCVYAIHTTGFEVIDGQLSLSPEQVDELQAQLQIDERCMQFGKFAVITPAVPFLAQLKTALAGEHHRAQAKLVEYYNEETFHGEIPLKEIPFRKQKRFSYQKEFRLCVFPRTSEEADNASPITINIGDISHICAKVESSQLPELIQLKTEPEPPLRTN